MTGELNLAQMRQHYRAAIADSEENAQRLLSLGVGAAAAVLLLTAPMLGPALQAVWVGLCIGLAVGSLLGHRRAYRRLHDVLLEQQLQLHTPIDVELWHRVGELRNLPAPLDTYVARFLSTYRDMLLRLRTEDAVELGQVQTLQYRDLVFEFLELAERTGNILTAIETQGHRLSDDDKVMLRRRFSEQCAGLQQLVQSFDRSLGSFVMAQVLGDSLGESTIDDVRERMRSIEDEFDEVKHAISVETS